MTASGPSDPFDREPRLVRRLFGKRSTEPGSPSLPASEADDDDGAEEVTVEGRTMEDVVAKLRAQGIDNVSEELLRSSMGDKHPHVIKVIVKKSWVTRDGGQMGPGTTIARADDQGLLTTGMSATGTVTSVVEVDPTLGMAGELLVSLTVHRIGDEDITTVLRTDPAPERRHLLFPGAVLTLRIDPNDPHHVGVDWNAAGTAPG